jgi:hypothetical protein
VHPKLMRICCISRDQALISRKAFSLGSEFCSGVGLMDRHMLSSEAGSAQVVHAMIPNPGEICISGVDLIRARRPGRHAPLKAKSTSHVADRGQQRSNGTAYWFSTSRGE